MYDHEARIIDAVPTTQLVAAHMAEKKKRIGAFSVRLTPEELQDLDDLRRAEPSPPSRGGMVKLLIARAKEAKGGTPKKS